MSSHDFHQGKLGNCWFVAACSCLALRKSLWQQVIPDYKEQEWDPKNPRKYAGIFRFRFWRFGEWTEVVVDDLLPTENGELIYCHSNVRNEFWSALLEKAYAKLAGSYQALDGGCAAEALVDFTGAVAESINLEEGKYGEVISEQMKLFEDLMKVHKRGGFISCSISESPGRPSEAETGMGLIVGHAYSVTAIRKLRLGESLLLSFKAEKLFMIRLRNPWGKKEWHGAWSDSSEEWKKVSDSERKNLGLTVENDGEFWMTFEDWCKNFTDVDICRTVNTSYFSLHKTWEKEMMYGAWAKHPEPLLNRSGGCFDNSETFLQNPQVGTPVFCEVFENRDLPAEPPGGKFSEYLFDVKKAQDKVLVSLQQEDRRKYKKEGKGDNITIGFEILKVEDNRRYRLHKLTVQERVATSPYSNTRSVFLRRTLQQGRYVLVPTTYIPGVPTKFILRLYTDVPSKLRELKADRPKMTCWSLLCGYPRRVTQIKVHSAEGLQKQDRSGASPLINCTLIHPADVPVTSLALCPFSTPPYALYLLITVNDGVLLCSLPFDKVVNTVGVMGKTPFDPDPNCFAEGAAFPALVTQPGADPYVLIKCENQSRRSLVQHDTTSPVFNTQVIFYRKDIDSPVTIQVWSSSLLGDRFLGQAVLAASPGQPRRPQRLRLRGRGGGEAAEVPGHISLTVLCSDDLAEL
ncbi:hypothetical protein DV515_00010787 [Chloebia gouldiae]|uniref:Uncharacterized protein n=1 Tax=Chloebia gouldiae TaxID=44316 RepID=A0A3L8S9E9_CHLGU|nr:hypothetical protein DV515_00010787 [Chloebia gouldiae]